MFLSNKISFIERFNFNNINQLPSIDSILISSCSNQILVNQSYLFNLLLVLELLTQRTPSIIRAKRSLASFKLRKNTAIGGKVSLNKNDSLNFISKLNLLILMRISQFRGFSLASKDVLNLGIRDVHSFFEIENKADRLKTPFGLTITIKINSKSLQFTKYLVNELQIPCQ